MCNLSWTPHSNLEKDNSLKTTPVLAQRWAVWSILTILREINRCGRSTSIIMFLKGHYIEFGVV